MPEPEKLEIDPPEIVRSEAVKSVEFSESKKVRFVFSPAFREEASALMAMVGLTVSIERVTLLSASEPSLLKLPAASQNLAEGTASNPLVVLLVEGVNLAE